MMIRFERTTNELKFNYDGGAPTEGPTSQVSPASSSSPRSQHRPDQPEPIVIQVIEEVVGKHGLVALLQETPFVGISGSWNVQ